MFDIVLTDYGGGGCGDGDGDGDGSIASFDDNRCKYNKFMANYPPRTTCPDHV